MDLLKIKRKGKGNLTLETTEVIAPAKKDELAISALAAQRIEELRSAHNDPALVLRVAIRGGGCSGLSLHYELSSDTQPNDVVFTRDSAQVVIDKKSLSILGGATLHVREYLSSKEFFLVNNTAEKQCSCGKSFAL